MNKKIFPAIMAVMVVSGVVAPSVLTTQAASFGSGPWDIIEGFNFTDKGPGSHWQKNSVSADLDDVVSVIVFVKNASSDTAEDVRVKLSTSVNSGGDIGTITATISANNASNRSGSFEVILSSSGDITSLDHTGTTKLYDAHLNQKTFSGSASDVVSSSGLSIGNVESGDSNSRFVIADFRVEGTTDNGNGGGSALDVETLDADRIDNDSARLRCSVDTGDEDADVWFEWGTSRTNLDKDADETRVNDNRTNVTIVEIITGLDEDTRYFFRCVAEDDDGNEDRGSIREFRTDDDGDDDGDDEGDAPDVTTLSATGIDSVSATLRGEVDPNGEDTDAQFEWGTSRTNLNRTTSRQDVGSGTREVAFSSRITGLSANTTYFFRAVAENDEGDDEGSILSFTTASPAPPIVNMVTRFVDVFRTVEVEAEPEVEALIITLNANAVDIDNRVIDYTVSYDNRTRLFLTNVVLTVDLPRELEFIDANPNPSRDLGDQLVFNIGRVEPGESDSFLIETELDRSFDEGDEIRFVATVEYSDDGSARKVVEVIDESTFGELATVGGFTATMIDAFRGFFTNPLLWIILFALLVFFAIRYLLSSRDRRHDALV